MQVALLVCVCVASVAALLPSLAPTITINPLVSTIKMSSTVQIFGKVKELQAAGEKVTSLCVGEPDFPPPKAVLKATVDAVNSGQTTYTAVQGTMALRTAISKDLHRRKDTQYDPNTEILVSNGAKQSMYQAVLALCGPGDEVLIPSPYWPSYPEMVALAGATPVIVPTKLEEGFLLQPDVLETHITDRTKCLILCNPSNPSGAVHPESLLRKLGGVLEGSPNVAVIADEIYERLVYSECPLTPQAPQASQTHV